MAESPVRRLGWLSLGVAVASTIAACGGASSGAPAVSVSPSRSTATVAQYASIVATNRPKIVKSYHQVQGCAVFYNNLCGIYAITSDLVVKTLAVDLHGAVEKSPGNQLYIGQPPAEVASLVRDTRTDATAVLSAFKALDHPRRAVDFQPLEFALSSLNDDLNGWKPYGG